MDVLFSPVGTADPLTILGDGPMLHIVRFYKPDDVVLFLSPKMQEFQNCDHRYTRAIELLCKKMDIDVPNIHLVSSKRNDVQHFDAYIEEFEHEIKKIRALNKNAQIFANVTSGTPAMEQALVALGAFGEYDLKLLQVFTPRKGINRPDDRERPDYYDLETLWELNPDNDGAEVTCRVEQVALPNFKERLLRKSVSDLVDCYDYEAALRMALQSTQISTQAINLIQSAINRLNLNSRKQGRDRLPEYLYKLEVLLKREQWGDFVRSLTPAFTWTAIRLLDRNQLHPSDYLKYPPDDLSGDFCDELDLVKIQCNPNLYKILSSVVSKNTKHLANWMLDELADSYCPRDISKRLHLIRRFEEGSRNELAHRIVKSDRASLEMQGGSSFNEVMAALFSLNHVEPGEYERINRQIKSLL